MRKEGGCERRERMQDGQEEGKNGRREEKLKMPLGSDVRSKATESVGLS